MGFLGKIFGKTKTTKQTEKSTSTSTPNVPDWLLQPSQQLAGQLGGLIGAGPAASSPVMGGLQQQTFDAAKGLSTSPYYGQAADALGKVQDVGASSVGASSLLEGLDKYYNPFKEQVLNPALSDYDYQAGQTRAQQAAQAAAGGAFRGSRYGIQEAQTEGELARGRAATEGGLLNQMYGQATTLSSQDAARRQEAAMANAQMAQQAALANQAAGFQRAGFLADLGGAQGADERANLTLQNQLGGQETGFLNSQRQYPLEYQKQLTGLLSGLNPALYTGQTTQGEGSSKTTQTSVDPVGTALKIAQIAAMSDARVKTGIRTVGHDAKGRRWVEFSYVWAPSVRYLGVIAQEVLASDPQAVLTGPGGLLLVDYGSL